MRTVSGESHTNTDHSLASNHKSQTGARKKSLNAILLLGAATVLVAIIIAVWVAGLSTTTFDISANDPGNVGEIRVSEDAELRDLAATFMELGERLDDVNERIQLLADPMPGPDNSLSSVDQQQAAAIGEESAIEMIQMIEPTAAGKSDTLKIANAEADKSAVDGAVKHEAREKAAPASDKRDTENISTKSPWVVNLVSLSSKADADRFAARARSKGIQAELFAVTVKGKQYWRVHASGFSTAAEAKSQANVIKEKLGLQDVWITKR
jgi:cell division septation protein DedD